LDAPERGLPRNRVTRFGAGDEVYGVSAVGSFAEYARSRELDLARKPANLSFEQAATVPVSGMTALQACVTSDACSRASMCWSSARQAASARSPSNWPARSAPG
jgi:NADPH:quinone reductase-like Zn-dependent oxidoreductase